MEKKENQDTDRSRRSDNKFRAPKIQKEVSKREHTREDKSYEKFRIQLPPNVAKDFPEGTRFWIGHKPGTDNIQLFVSGTGLPNPIDNSLDRPQKLKQEDYITGDKTEVKKDYDEKNKI